MHQTRSGLSSLARALREARKGLGFTQAEMAEKAGIVERTARNLEHGKGNIQTFQMVLAALDVVLGYRNAPPLSIPEVIRTLRARRQLSQRELARISRVSHPTIGSLEKGGTGQLAPLERVLNSLGAGAYVAPRGQSRAFYTHAGNSSVGMAWETPKALLGLLDGVFGKWDLDPCSPRKNGPVNAKVRFTAEDDGLSVPWNGSVYANPPYGRGLRDWIGKARREYELGNAKLVVLLIPARPDTSYWHDEIADHAEVIFLRGRLRFGESTQSAPFPSALILYGIEQPRLIELRHALSLQLPRSDPTPKIR